MGFLGCVWLSKFCFALSTGLQSRIAHRWKGIKRNQWIVELWTFFCALFQKAEVKRKVSISILKTHHVEMLCRYLSQHAVFLLQCIGFHIQVFQTDFKPMCFLLKSHQQWLHVPLFLCCDSCCCSGPDLDTHVALCPQTSISSENYLSPHPSGRGLPDSIDVDNAALGLIECCWML